MFKVDYSKAENPNPHCVHKTVEVLEVQKNKLTKQKQITVMCSECGVYWDKYAKN